MKTPAAVIPPSFAITENPPNFSTFSSLHDFVIKVVKYANLTLTSEQSTARTS